MRRLYGLAIASFIVALIALVLSFPHHVEAAPPSLTLQEARQKVDQWLAARWPTIQDRQATYLANHGRYWQGLRSNISNLTYTDATDASIPADNLGSSPTDQIETWLAVFPELNGINFPAVVWIDTYNGPEGQGYVASVFICHNANCYLRSQNVGPEAWRTAAWSVVQSQVTP
jgi:hypothetical protein